jgi:predicted nucleotidyltransferase
VQAPFSPLPAPWASWPLDRFLELLSSSPEVNGLVLFGSTGERKTHDYSDNDVFVITSEMPPIFFACTRVEDKLCDLTFAGLAELEQAISPGPSLEHTDDRRGWMLAWLSAGEVVFDREGRVAALQDGVRRNPPVFDPDAAELFRRWDHANYNLAQSARYASSPEPLYRRAFELRMTYQLADLMVDYFWARKLVWRGEKEALKYWEDHDPEYARTFFDCLHERDAPQRLTLYQALVGKTFAGLGGVWPREATSISAAEGADPARGADYWSRLVGLAS